MTTRLLDAVVVGACPNGLAAAITLARAGCSVAVVDAIDTVGGGVSSAALTEPGFVHDVCLPAVYPMGVGSPFFRSLRLGAHGVDWVHADAPLAHPLDGGRAVVLHRSLDETAMGLGADGAAYSGMVGGLVELWRRLVAESDGASGGPTFSSLRSWHAVRVALRALPLALRSARSLARGRLHGDEGRALVAGLGAHGMLPLTATATGAFVLSLGAAAPPGGWPIVRGGSSQFAAARAAVLRGLGGTIETGRRVHSLGELPPSRAVVLDVSPRELLRLASDRLPRRYGRQVARYRRGSAAFKIDYALDRPIPWEAAACRGAGVVHVGGTADEIEAAFAQVAGGRTPPRPFVLVAQPSLFDRSRVPAQGGFETAWAYCHVPNGSSDDMTDAIENQIERFAPGFRSCVRARHRLGPAALEAHDSNLEGGDIGGGACDVRQLLLRPVPRLVPWTTPDPRLFLCSASTPPGPGVHGMCGYLAARVALRALRRRRL